jgi:hypothetical protein
VIEWPAHLLTNPGPNRNTNPNPNTNPTLPLPLTLTPPLTPPLTLTRYKGLKVRAERKMRECSEAKEVLVKQMGC